MDTVDLVQNGVFVTVPAAQPGLSLRYRDMLAINADDFGKHETAAMWDALADDWDDIGYYHMATRCRRNAADVMRSR